MKYKEVEVRFIHPQKGNRRDCLEFRNEADRRRVEESKSTQLRSLEWHLLSRSQMFGN